MRRPLPCFIAFVAIYLAAIAWGWLQQAATAGELLGHAAKVQAILELLRSGDVAWFPAYLGGAPSATLLSFALAVPIYAPGLWLIPDPALAMKTTALVLLATSGFAAFAFGRRISGSGWSGFATGCAWLLAPQLLQRAGMLEHMTILVAAPLVPLTFLAMLRVAERGTAFDAILLALSFSATLLAWSKMGATLVLSLGLFAAWLFVARPECRMNLIRGALWAAPATLLLGIIPLLPLLRERAFMTVFEMDPFRLWQATYSLKSGTAWFDRSGALFESLPPAFRIDAGGYYLGLVGIAAVAVTIFLTWRERHDLRALSTIRFFLVVALSMAWISFGPRSVLQGHFELLAGSKNFPDAAVTLHWLVLAAQGLLIYWCFPPKRWRLGVFLVTLAVYLFLPAFRILEHFPLYADLRAPDSFWILNGTFAWAVASALCVVFVLHKISARLRVVAGIAVLAAACIDFSPYFGWFYRGGIDAQTFADYKAAAEKLRETNGRILPLSSRYFYLSIPGIAGRPLSNEALNHYLMPRDSARVQAAARGSATSMLVNLQLAGVSQVLVDNAVSDTSQQWFRSLLPVEFENKGFAILSNPASLYPGFFADASVPAPAGFDEYVDAIEQAKSHRITIAASPGQTFPASPAVSSPSFARLEPPELRSNSRIVFAAPGRTGWVVLSESWHPDWHARVNGKPTPVFRAAGAYPAVPVDATSSRIEFRFEPPAWYAACLWTGGTSWAFAFAFLGIARWVPRARKRFFEAHAAPPLEMPAFSKTPISRPIALVPTYNESGSIGELLDRALQSEESLHVLVIDDGSPDGTASQVRAHREHGRRVHLLERAGKQGLGSAYREAFRWAMERGYDACIEMDADLSHDPADIPRLLAALESGADAAIGSRYLGGLRVVNWPKHRLWLSTGASRYVHFLTGLPLTDATSGFKALRATALAAIDWQHLRADGYGFQIELHWLLWKTGARLVEVPIVFTERRAGRTKMTAGIAFEAAARVLQLSVMNSPTQRPR